MFITCYLFDGVDDYILSTYGKLIPNQNIYTITGWFNIPSTAIGVSNRVLVALSEGSFPRFSPCFWTQYKPIIYLSSSNFKYGTSDLRDDKWHYVVFIVTGSNNEDINNAKIYVDGIEEKYSTPLSSTAPTAPNGNFTIGEGFIGKLDDVRIYNAALSSSQIKKQYVAGLDSLLSKNLISKEEYNIKIESLASN
ncbi:MAG: LamG domain-containing protein [Candidatus Pacebacteria bacterium]|nr:LamG domain-containing protein [Candidatus Paceibacterota bacterium]